MRADLLDLFRVMWEEQRVPEECLTALIVPIYKVAASEAKWATTLMSVVVVTRLTDYVESNRLIGEEQGGFREGRGCMDQMFVLSEILRGGRKASSPIL